MLKKPIEIFCIELELAPYKFDLWNEFTQSNFFNVTAFFTEEKNYEKDASHNYLNFPSADFSFSVESGKTILSKLKSVLYIFKKIISPKYNYIYISGYNHFVTFTTVVLCIFFRKQYLLNTDLIVFKNNNFLLNIIKNYFLIKAHKILLCNRKFSDKKFVRENTNIIDFTYYVSRKRLLNDEPTEKPLWLKKLFDSREKTIIFVSSRLIPRKGCEILLEAFRNINKIEDVILLIEGNGSEYELINKFILKNNLKNYVKMLGFSQFKTHSWLIRNCDIVIVPSHEDNWGIVVDEGLKLNKIVISTYSTGSAVSLINHGINGYLYESHNSKELTKLIDQSIFLNKKRNLKPIVELFEDNIMSERLYQNLLK